MKKISGAASKSQSSYTLPMITPQSPTKPCIGVSSCLLGNAVRYDGGHKYQSVTEQLAEHFILVPFCPEVAAGMGVPRPPIQLVETDEGVRALGIADPTQDMTKKLQACINELPELISLAGYVFKARSPSCGVIAVPVYQAGVQNSLGQGIFVSELLKRRPDLPMIEEDALTDTAQLDRFMEQVMACHQTLVLNK